MIEPKKKAMSSLGVGLSLIGLLITAAIIIYLVKMTAEVNVQSYRHSQEGVDDIEEALSDRAKRALQQGQERTEEMMEEGSGGEEPQPAETQLVTTTQPADAEMESSDRQTGGVEPGTPLGGVSPVAPVAPMTGSEAPNARKAKQPATSATGGLEQRNRELEEMLE